MLQEFAMIKPCFTVELRSLRIASANSKQIPFGISINVILKPLPPLTGDTLKEPPADLQMFPVQALSSRMFSNNSE